MTTREARPEDLPDMARIRVDTWKAAYCGIVPDAYLDSLTYTATENHWRRVLWEENRGSFAFVATDSDGQVVGIAMAGPVFSKQETEYKGEIYVLYVLPGWQRQGFGRQLVRACGLKLVQPGLTPILIWTLAQNPARAFYEKLGGVVAREKQVERGGKELAEVGYGWIDGERLVNVGTSG